MNILINGVWYSAIEQENQLAVEIPKDEMSLFNGIYDNAHKTHGKTILLGLPYAYLHQEPNDKGKISSKCKVGQYTNCCLENITPNYHKGLAYAFFSYDKNIEC